MSLEITESDKRKIVGKLLKEMWGKSYFDISTVDKCFTIMGVRRPSCYDDWHKLHCVDWSKMPDDMPERLMGSILRELTKLNIGELIDAALCAEPAKQAQLVIDTMRENK